MDHRQKGLRNAANPILKLRVTVAVQELKISFYMQVLMPSYFWLVPPHFVCSGDGTVTITNKIDLLRLASIPIGSAS